MGSTAVFTALSFCSSAVLHLIPLSTSKGYDVHSAWVSWCILFITCLIGRRKSRQTQEQQYELLETGSPRLPNFTKERECLGVPLLALLSSAAVVAGVLANTLIAQYSTPLLVILTTVICFLETPGHKSVSLKSESVEYSGPTEKRLLNSWSLSRLCYNTIISLGVAVVIYQNTQSRPDLMQTGLAGAGFLVCMAVTYASLAYSANSDTTYASDEAAAFKSTDWKLATRVSAQALCLATVLVAFAPYNSNLPFADILISGALQAIRWSSVYQLTTSGSVMASTTSQLAALGFAQAFLLQQNMPSGFFAASIIIAAAVMCFITLPVSDRFPLWANCLIMAMPFLTLPMSVLTLQASMPKLHPIEQLHMDAQLRLEAMVSRQSKTVEEAITEYRRRYHRDPPEGFDFWVELALEKGFLLIDEFDVMTEAFEPFRRVKSSVLTRRIDDMIAQDLSSIVTVKVEDGEVFWDPNRQYSYFGVLMKQWLTADSRYKQLLTNQTILLDTYDAPEVMADWATVLGDGNSAVQEKVEWISPGHYAWGNMTASCPENSPARSGILKAKDHTLSFISDRPSSLDVCQNPEYKDLHGLLLAEGGTPITRQLVPIWSQDRPSTFQDILYPSPYYEKHRIDYNGDIDSAWEDKASSLYWAGSTTGGFNTLETWFKMPRARLLLATMPETGPHDITLLDQASPSDPWKSYSTDSAELQRLFHLKITNIVQCEEPTCAKLREAFPQGEQEPVSASYDHKYVLDMDGNGFSGRYYRVLRSRSAVIKQTILKEWHDDWLVPWIHFIPLSMEGDELWEMMRFFATTKRGNEIGAEIAMRSREWTEKVLRQVDMDMVTLRIFLEYASLFKET